MRISYVFCCDVYYASEFWAPLTSLDGENLLSDNGQDLEVDTIEFVET